MVCKEEEPKIDWKVLEAITKKVLAFKPKKKRESTVKRNHDAGQEPHVRAKSN
jgi:hypothetical protein